MMIYKRPRPIQLAAAVVVVVLLGTAIALPTPSSTRIMIPQWLDFPPVHYLPSIFQETPVYHVPEPRTVRGKLGSTMNGFFGLDLSALGLQVDKKSVPVNITNLPVPAVVLNESLPVTVRNASLGVQVLNVPLPVGIVNRTLAINVTNVPLPTVVVNNSLPVTLTNSSVPVEVLYLPLPVGIVNETVYVNVTNIPLPTVVVNNSFPVTLSNSSVPVKVLDLPLPVGIVNASLPVNVQNLPLPVGLVNGSIPVSVLNDTLKVNVQNTPLSVNVNNQPLAVNIQNTPVPVTFDQPISVTSNQLGSYLASINASNSAILNFLQNQRFCPTDSNFGTGLSAPCRRLNSTCYCIFNNVTKTSSEAAAFCRAAGFDGLVSFETRVEAALVADLLYLLVTGATTTTPMVYFTSGSDAAAEGSYQWTANGQPFDPAETYWRVNEPNGGTNENCLALLFPDGRWVDTSCTTARNFICELSSVSNAIG